MDCEKFEATMIDELYDELDELTSAAAQRHVSGCARCAALLSGLRATRRVAVLPLVEPPDDLEDRILTAAKNAQRVMPLRGRVARAISRAGGWAMQPQTAMAAVFLLMIGSGALLLRGRQAKSPASTPVTVTDEGVPVASPAGTSTTASALDEPSAAADNAHGYAQKPSPSLGPVTATTDGENEKRRLDPAKADFKDKALSRAADDRDNAPRESQIDNAGTPGGTPNTLPQAQNAPPAAPPPSPASGGPSGGAGGSGYSGADFNNAMAAYNAGRYDEASRLFATLAPSDVYSALWEARSVREGSGKCRLAAAKFDSVAGRAAGGVIGYDGLLEGGRCYRVTGQLDVARERLTRLLSVPSHEARARTELQAMGGTPPAAKASPRAAPAATGTGSMKSDQTY
jgi:hypothetical protein